MARHVVIGDGELPPLLVPVPLHRWRLWSRGFNQAALIAGELARIAGGRAVNDALVRKRRTPPLRGMNPAARRRTVSGAFAVAPGRETMLRGRHVILIDDVWTTGATAAACAKVLRRAGVARVDLICWARVMPDGVAD